MVQNFYSYSTGKFKTSFTTEKGIGSPLKQNVVFLKLLSLINTATYHRFLEQKIGIKLGNNDIVLGVNEAHYTIFDVKPLNPNRNNILDNHIAEMKNLGYNYNYWVKDIDILYSIWEFVCCKLCFSF